MSIGRRLTDAEARAAELAQADDGTPRKVLTIDVVYRDPKTGVQPGDERVEYSVWHDAAGVPHVVKALTGDVSMNDL
jgi:hypothetical protein